MQDNPRRLLLRLGVKLMSLAGIAVVVYILFSATDGQSPPLPQQPPQLSIPLTNLTPGDIQRIPWQGGNLILLYYDEPLRQQLGNHRDKLHEPGALLSQQTVYLAYDRGTGLGCPLQWHPPSDLLHGAPVQPWPGGFRDSCDGAWFDAAGRVFHRQATTRNLQSPAYRLTGNLLEIGVSGDNPVPAK